MHNYSLNTTIHFVSMRAGEGREQVAWAKHSVYLQSLEQRVTKQQEYYRRKKTTSKLKFELIISVPFLKYIQKIEVKIDVIFAQKQ